MGRFDRAWPEALLPRAGAHIPDRVRQHAERGQSRPLGVARFPWRLRPRSPARTPAHVASLVVPRSMFSPPPRLRRDLADALSREGGPGSVFAFGFELRGSVFIVRVQGSAPGTENIEP